MTTTIVATETRTALYRFFDADMNLLYVGITDDPWRRQRQHFRQKPWWPRAKHWTVTWHDTEPEARSAELKAIKGEAPRFNIADMPAPVPAGFSVQQGAAALMCSVIMALPLIASVPLGIWHLRMPEYAAIPFLGSALLAMVALWLILFTSQIRDFLAWIDQHVLDVSSGANRPRVVRVGLRLYQFQGAQFAPIAYRRALLDAIAPTSGVVNLADRRRA
jgi:hypothetical protein